MLAAHPFQTGPNSVNEAVLGVAVEAPHWLVLVSPVFETHQRPAPLRRLARRFSASSAVLAGPVACSVTARAITTLMPEALS